MPQFAAAVAVSTQVPAQRVWPVGHGGSTHAPAAQSWPAAHAVPQPPQCAVEVRVSASQPLSAMPSQLARPVMHAMPQAPAAQVAVAPAGDGHARPHMPQLPISAWRLLQVVPQSVRPAPQVEAQAPVEHISRAEHARPHMPQFVLEEPVSTHAPAQRVCPVGHGGSTHTPAAQA